MKTFSVLALAFVLTATIFAGCRRQTPSTTGTTGTAGTTTTTAAATKPSGSAATQPTTGILPDSTSATDGMDSTGAARRHPGPRY